MRMHTTLNTRTQHYTHTHTTQMYLTLQHFNDLISLINWLDKRHKTIPNMSLYKSIQSEHSTWWYPQGLVPLLMIGSIQTGDHGNYWTCYLATTHLSRYNILGRHTHLPRQMLSRQTLLGLHQVIALLLSWWSQYDEWCPQTHHTSTLNQYLWQPKSNVTVIYAQVVLREDVAFI